MFEVRLDVEADAVERDAAPDADADGGDLVLAAGAEVWPRMAKDAVARRLAERIAAALQAR